MILQFLQSQIIDLRTVSYHLEFLLCVKWINKGGRIKNNFNSPFPLIEKEDSLDLILLVEESWVSEFF